MKLTVMYYFLPYFKGIEPLLLPLALVGFLLKKNEMTLSGKNGTQLRIAAQLWCWSSRVLIYLSFLWIFLLIITWESDPVIQSYCTFTLLKVRNCLLLSCIFSIPHKVSPRSVSCGISPPRGAERCGAAVSPRGPR